MSAGDMAGQSDRVANSDSRSTPRPNQHKILQACQQRAEQYLTGLFKEVMDKLDDVLFERGNKGGTEADVFIEAARELRLKRQEMFGIFQDKFAESYKARMKYSAFAASMAKKEKGQGGGLSLIDEQDLEESLAIDGLVAKANDRLRNDLYALAQRFNQLIDGAKYSDEMQPLSPDTIAHAFRDSFAGLEWKVENKLAAYKLFEKNVLQTLGEFYQQINTMLCDSGILPEMKLGVSIRSTGGAAQGRPSSDKGDAAQEPDQPLGFLDDEVQPAAQATAASEGAPQAATMTDVYQTLQQLMNVRKFGAADGAGASSGGAATGSGGGDGMAAGPPLPTDDLVRGLSLLQQSPLPADSGGQINVALIKEALMDQMRQIGDGRGLSAAHDNTIDVIGMIFEFILDEPSIPDVVKNLLNCLQIPILKVAIVDKAFFTNKTHPARRLLNVLGHASIGWNDNSEDARQRRFEKMEYVVKRVLAEFEQDPNIFASLLDEFSAFLADEGAEIGEEQAPPSEEEAQDESLDRLAFETIEMRLEGMELPEVLRNFLRDTWRNVMQYTLDHEGRDSDGWSRREQTIDDLIWSVEPKATSDERRKMVMLLPRLLGDLRDGMTQVACSQQEMDAVIDALEPIHMACLHGDKPQMAPPKAEQPDKAASASSDDVTDMIRSIQEGMTSGDDQLFGETVEEIGADESMSDMVETEAEEQIDDEFTAQAANMKLGTWLEFTLDGNKRRGKLAWKSAVMGEYVFVDRRYKVVAERNLAGLAADLRHGRASLVEDVAMFDRALDKVLNGLMAGGKTEH